MPLNVAGLALGDQLIVVIAALLINAAFGGPRFLYLALKLDLPARLMAQGVRTLERKLNRIKRPPEQRRVRGTVLVTLLLMASLLIGLIGELLIRSFEYGLAIEILVVSILLAFRSPLDRAYLAARKLDDNELDEARQCLRGTAWRNAAVLDEHGLARAIIELLAHSFAVRVTASIVWYVVLGLPGLLASCMLVMIDEILAQNEAQQQNFGMAAHVAGVWLFALPCLLAAIILLAGSAFSPTSHPAKALAEFRRRLRESGFEGLSKLPVAVLAGACNAALGGPASVYGGNEWVGSGTLKPGATDIRRALYVYLLAGVLLLILLSLLVA